MHKIESSKKSDGDGYQLIERAACVLAAKGKRKEARELHQLSSIRGYDFWFCLKFIKEFGVYDENH